MNAHGHAHAHARPRSKERCIVIAMLALVAGPVLVAFVLANYSPSAGTAMLATLAAMIAGGYLGRCRCEHELPRAVARDP